MSPDTTSFKFGFISDDDRRELKALGAVGDLMFNFYDPEGRLVDHPINRRVMSIPVEQLRAVPRRIIASGGEDKIQALLGAIKLIDCNGLITNEATARALIAATG
jgi:DNA-binding transcriptional regulator LsrR (DeoR family)